MKKENLLYMIYNTTLALYQTMTCEFSWFDIMQFGAPSVQKSIKAISGFGRLRTDGQSAPGSLSRFRRSNLRSSFRLLRLCSHQNGK